MAKSSEPVVAGSEEVNALINRVRSVLDYDPETGILRWRVALSNRAPIGTRAGNIGPWGYREVSIDNVTYRSTTLIWIIVHGCFPSILIDHRDTFRANDCLSNLRKASHAENARNVRMHRDNASGFKGVIFHVGRRKPWQARIYLDGHNRSLGYYLKPEEAHAAYFSAAVDHFGEFARAA